MWLWFDKNIWPSFIYSLFVHDHSTKVRGHSYSIISLLVPIFRLQYCLYISSVIFIPLYFVHYIHGSAALIFCMLYPWPNELFFRSNNGRYWPRFRLLQPWALILHYCEKLVIAKSIQLSSVNFYGLLQCVTTWTRNKATYCGRLGQHGECYNTNMLLSFSNSRLCF